MKMDAYLAFIRFTVHMYEHYGTGVAFNSVRIATTSFDEYSRCNRESHYDVCSYYLSIIQEHHRYHAGATNAHSRVVEHKHILGLLSNNTMHARPPSSCQLCITTPCSSNT
jgi:hypothetical protein